MKRLTLILSLVMMVNCSRHPDLGDGYRFDNDGEYTLQIVNSQNTVMINSHILEVVFDSTFIVVSQRPWDSIPGIREMNYTKSRETFEKSSFIQYWIINKKEKNIYTYDELTKMAKYSNVYGPFKVGEYLQMRRKLKIPDKLKLEAIN